MASIAGKGCREGAEGAVVRVAGDVCGEGLSGSLGWMIGSVGFGVVLEREVKDSFCLCCLLER